MPSEVPSIGFCFCCPIQNSPFSPSFVGMLSFAPKSACTFKNELRKCFFRLFVIHKHIFTLLKEFLVAASNIAICSYSMLHQESKRICKRDGMCTVMNQCPGRLGFGVWLVGVLIIFLAVLCLLYRKGTKKKLWNIAPKIAFLWLLPSLTPLYS